MKTVVLTQLKQLGKLLLWWLPLLVTGFWLASNPHKMLALALFAQEHSLLLMATRWVFYVGIVWAWPSIAWRAVSSSAQRSSENSRAQHQKVLASRWQIARLLVVYELVFPLNILAVLGDTLGARL